MAKILPTVFAMKSKTLSRLPSKCAYADCISLPLKDELSPKTAQIVRKGNYRRSSDCRVIPRFYCRSCERSFSSAIYSPCFQQKKRTFNDKIRKMLVSGVSQRRIARLLKLNRKTVTRKFLFLAERAAVSQSDFLARYKTVPATEVYFDEMESFEHSKCKPVSIPLIVTAERKILGFRVCSMPAKGHLAKISRARYGFRKNERPQAARSLWSEMQPFLNSHVKVISDECPPYRFWIRSSFPKANHKTYLSRRACVVGQGELKAGGFDPLFAFNHTAAMIRANVNRLFRRTWNTTKLKERLAAHLIVYIDYHNQVLTPNLA